MPSSSSSSSFASFASPVSDPQPQLYLKSPASGSSLYSQVPFFWHVSYFFRGASPPKKRKYFWEGRHPLAGLSLNLAIKLWINFFLKQCSSNPSAPALIDLTPKGSSQVVRYLYLFTNPEIVFFRSPPPFRRRGFFMPRICL